MGETAKGVAAMLAACVIWGLSPIFYVQLAHVPPLEVLAHRTLWSLAFFAALLAVQGRLALAVRTGAQGAGVLALASLAISTNWFLFILATQIGRVTESSLGYYIFPLAAVVLGRLVLGERLSWAKWLAGAVAAAGVAVLTAGLGTAPWLSLALAASFAAYGLVKRFVAAGPVISVAVEVTLLTPLALVFLAAAGHRPDAATWLLLVLSGPMTAAPLVLFSYASKRVRLSTIGLIQYLNPTLQFGCAIVWFGESPTIWHAVAFPAIWVALMLYSADSLRAERNARRTARQAVVQG